MKLGKWIGALMLLLILGLGAVCDAQEVNVPFTWNGKGTGFLMEKDGINSLDFNLKISVDQDGIVSGETSTDDGNAAIERLYYTESSEGVRQLVLVIRVQGDDPVLYLLVGRAMKNRLFYGEVFTKKFEKDGSVEKELNIGDKTAAQFSEEGFPDSVKKAMKASKLIGCFKVSGDFSK